ncbi:MAG: hypothetical protein ACJ75Z_04450 [Solirubrobacterales bacterium]
MPRRAKIAALCVALVAVLAVSAVADAAAPAARGYFTKRVASNITLETVNQDGARGNVSSNKGACQSERTVFLYREESWTSVPTSGVWATARTKPDGSWVVPGPLPQGVFYAVVQPNRNGKLACGDSTSREAYV